MKKSVFGPGSLFQDPYGTTAGGPGTVTEEIPFFFFIIFPFSLTIIQAVSKVREIIQ